MARSKTEIYVSPLTVLYIALALLLGRFSFIFFHFLCSFIHELSHIICAKSLKKEVKEISFLPIGFFAKIDNLEEEKPWKQILILSSGPLSYFISFALITLLFKNHLISTYGYSLANEANKMIMIFNLIPIVPLDGGRIVKALLLKFIPCHKAYKLSIVISCFVSLGLIVLCIINTQYLVLGFLLFDLVVEIIFTKKKYLQFLFKRTIKENNYPFKVHDKIGIYSFKHNWKVVNDEIYDEKELVNQEIKRVMSKRGI